MAGKKGNKNHANKTSYPNQKGNKRNPKIVYRKFKKMLTNAQTDEEILSFQDACWSISWRDSKVNYWCDKIPVFATLKSDIQNAIIRRINSKALKSEFNATSAIWREKQLGEKDKVEKDININNIDDIDKINFVKS